MVHGAPWTDACLQQRIHKAAVMIQPFHVWGVNARGLDARPRNGKAIALQIELLGECDVLRVEMILVTCNIAGHTTPHLTRCVGELSQIDSPLPPSFHAPSF